MEYRKFTIRELYNTIDKIMAENPSITMGTEIIISDINMSSFKQGVRVYPTFDYKDNKVKVGIYLNPYEKDELVEEEPTKKATTPKAKVYPQKFNKEYESGTVKVEYLKPTEEPVKELAWLNKYRR